MGLLFEYYTQTQQVVFKVSWDVESETLLAGFSWLCWNPFAYLCIDLLLLFYFLTCSGYLENIRSLGYVALPNMDISLCIVKNHIHWYRWQNVTKYWEAVQLTLVETSFLRFRCLLESLNYIYKYCQLPTPPWKWQAHFVHFFISFYLFYFNLL